MQIRKANIIHSVKHQKFVASFPCVVCGNDTQVQCCHIRSITELSYNEIGKAYNKSWFTIYASVKDCQKNGLKSFTNKIIDLVKAEVK